MVLPDALGGQFVGKVRMISGREAALADAKQRGGENGGVPRNE